MVYIEKKIENQIEISCFYTYYHQFLDKGQSYKGQRHPFWEINIVLNGSMTLTCGDKIITLTKGQMYLIPSEEFHSFIVPKEPAELLVLSFSMDFIPPDAVYTLSLSNMHLVEMIIEEMEYNNLHKTFIHSDKDVSQTLKLLTELLILRAVSQDAVPCTKSIHSDVYQTAVHFMKVNIFNELTLNDIAKHCGVSCSTLKNLFKVHTQAGIMHFYNELKMESAKEMLADNMSVSSIAEELHFSSTAHFSAAFKKYAGVSPMKYKKH